VLDELLRLANSEYSAREVVELFSDAQEADEMSSAVIPALFSEEPRFTDPQIAKRLYQNLLGLWDALAAGEKISARQEPRPEKTKRSPVVPPLHFPKEGPDTEWVRRALEYLGALDERGLSRLSHAFENNQDALLTFLDEQNLKDAAFGKGRALLFELFCFIQLGSPKGVASVGYQELERAVGQSVGIPEALTAYADGVLSEAGESPQGEIDPSELSKLRGIVRRCLKALWEARRR
jgi:hypothetical protein